jgi:hypothetical protein
MHSPSGPNRIPPIVQEPFPLPPLIGATSPSALPGCLSLCVMLSPQGVLPVQWDILALCTLSPFTRSLNSLFQGTQHFSFVRPVAHGLPPLAQLEQDTRRAQVSIGR